MFAAIAKVIGKERKVEEEMERMVVKEVMEREGTMMARSRLQQTAIRAITIALNNYLFAL